jgi:hypothetical protein
MRPVPTIVGGRSASARIREESLPPNLAESYGLQRYTRVYPPNDGLPIGSPGVLRILHSLDGATKQK